MKGGAGGWGAGFIRNVSWTMAATASRALAAGLALLFLGHTVSPETMGLYGVGWAVASLGYGLSQSGAAQGLIALREIDQRHASAARWLSLGISVLLALAVALSATLGERFYELPGLEIALFMAAGFIPLMSLPTVETALLQRDLEFRLVSLVQSVAAIVSAVASVLIAMAGHHLLALFALQGLVGPVTFLAFALLGRRAPFGRSGMQQFRELWSLGAHLSLGSLSNIAFQNAPQMLIAKFVGPVELGRFVFCQRILQLVVSQIMGMINTVVYPTFASVASDLSRVGQAYLKTSRYTIVLLATPLILLVIAPGWFLSLYGGEEWVPAAEVLRYLAIMWLGFGLGSNVFPTFQAIGRPSAAWQWNLFILLLQLVAIALAFNGGVLGIAKALALTGFVLPLAAYWLMHTLGMPYRLYVKSTLPIAVFIALAIFAGLWAATWLWGPIIVRLGLSWSIGLAVLGGLVLASDRTARSHLARIAGVARSKRSAGA